MRYYFTVLTPKPSNKFLLSYPQHCPEPFQHCRAGGKPFGCVRLHAKTYTYSTTNYTESSKLVVGINGQTQLSCVSKAKQFPKLFSVFFHLRKRTQVPVNTSIIFEFNSFTLQHTFDLHQCSFLIATGISC